MNIECSDQPLDVSFHPKQETIVAAALVDGTLEVHDFKPLLEDKESSPPDDSEDDEDDTILSSTPVHTQLLPNYITAGKDKDGDSDSSNTKTKTKTKVASCRAVQFSHDHNYLYTGGSAGDLCCIDAERVCAFSSSSSSSQSKTILWSIDSATVGRASTSHYNPLHVLHQLPVCSSKGPLIVSGDDQGGVRLWDERLCNVTSTTNNNNNNNGPLQLPQGCVLSWKESKDYISALDHSEDGHTLLASSADGSLTVFDIRHASTNNILQNVKNSKKDSIVKQSDLQDDELLSMVTMKQGRKVVCGTQDGVLAMWSWGTWGDISDRYPRATNGSSIDALLKLDETTLLTGSSDGLLRVVSLHPNKVIGALGQHDGFPIEDMEFSATRQFVGSISHDNYIRLWGMGVLNEDHDDGDDVEEGDDSGDEELPMASAPSGRGGQDSDDEWDDMDEDAEEMDDDDNDDSGEGDKNDKDSDDSDDDSDDEAPTENDARASRLQSKNADFFSDL